MSLTPNPPQGSWTVDSDSPLRIIAGWSDKDTEALQLACWIGRSVPITVQVVAPSPATWKALGPPSGKKFRKWLQRESDEYSNRARSALKSQLGKEQWADEPVRMATSASDSSSLIEVARDFGADVVVLGSRSTRPKGTFLVSTVADSLLDANSVPLVVAPRHPKLSKKGITRITYVYLGYDGFDYPSGLHQAARIAARLEVPIRLLAMSPDNLSGADFDTSIDTPSDSAQWYEATLGHLDLARDSVFEAASQAPGSTVIEVDVAVDHGWKRAMHSVKWKKGDLACFSFRRQSQFKRVFFSGPTSEFLRHCPAPSLIFPPSTA
ncbi:hypothetical protein EKI51_07985 [Corynebacterium sanguinis]|uniref:universal stress protein n=1 Tax=Corynebacterium sanguinis TaxID=2594913 RepID=UPI0011A48808|nr:universal stress protein [Corynebacterium sanguinis]MCT1555638.1 universal stress protein [Corynebacterium sanguinis]MCT1663967.1 universal stress protein [Corynebacterium sanguinis]MCT2252120.1 universal stress protein [Corynebacterium sanguinis]MDN8622940.1 universal stress protein [Corynebacterium sanguinis]TVS23276.1 hypothetical protein EKI51_07985 [Corynebacterium sanguinis]